MIQLSQLDLGFLDAARAQIAAGQEHAEIAPLVTLQDVLNERAIRNEDVGRFPGDRKCFVAELGPGLRAIRSHEFVAMGRERFRQQVQRVDSLG